MSKSAIQKEVKELVEMSKTMVALRKEVIRRTRELIQSLPDDLLDKLEKVDSSGDIYWAVDKIARGYFGTDSNANTLLRVNAALDSSLKKE